MKEPVRVLFVTQEIFPYLADETPNSLLNRKLPEMFQANGCETRTFMPKFGDINERRNQLHEVIRLSGMNLIIDDTDHPLLLKVASVQAARIQIYFVDNDEFFHRRKGIADEDGVEYVDNDERTIFYARGVLETIKKLRWTPDVIYVSGWMSALVPLYLRTAFSDLPFFTKAKIVYGLYDQTMNRAFPENFAKKLLLPGTTFDNVKKIRDKRVTYTDLLHLAIDYSDYVIQGCEKIPDALREYVANAGKPLEKLDPNEAEQYFRFFKSLIQKTHGFDDDDDNLF